MNGPPCLHCRMASALTNGREMYPGIQKEHDRAYWICRACQAWVACHEGTIRPMGYPADRPTRMARSLLHTQRLDPLWRDHGYSRNEIYFRLQQGMRLTPRQAHVGKFTLDQCHQAWAILEPLYQAEKENRRAL